MSTAPKRIRLYEASGPGRCSGCQARIVWHPTLNGKSMPMNADAVAVLSEKDATGALVLIFDAADAHWASCPARAHFRSSTPRATLIE
jgi:hypothetical protein